MTPDGAKRLRREVCSDMVANVWKVEVAVGQEVGEGDVLVILESMKMEIPVTSPRNGVVEQVCVAEGSEVAEGDLLAVLS